MKYPKFISTRGYAKQSPISFKQTVLTGLAPDGGLFVPTFFPILSQETINSWKTLHLNKKLSFQKVAFDVIKLYVPPEEVPHEVLEDIIKRSYSTFRHKDITPVVKLDENLYILELFHGPTFAFKDVALQFLGNLFEYFIQRDNKSITVVGATSGDTGSSAIEGLRGKNNVEVFILFPEGRVSEIQERQMTTVRDNNVHCLAVDGSFDDAQAIVKDLFNDKEFNEKVNLSAVNSINFARILAQIVYYFYSYIVVGKTSSFYVPTGNFGDILAGFYAKNMGLPVDDLVIATNSNDILYRFFSSGIYSRLDGVNMTIAPSMDICVSSNFERFMFHMLNNDSILMGSVMKEFESSGVIDGNKVKEKQNNISLLELCRKHMKAERLSDSEISSVIKSTYEEKSYLLDPHSACGVGALRKMIKTKSTTGRNSVCLACAHWGKFSPAVESAIGKESFSKVSLPSELSCLSEKETKKTLLKAEKNVIKEFILNNRH